jgi:hypothetical protein
MLCCLHEKAKKIFSVVASPSAWQKHSGKKFKKKIDGNDRWSGRRQFFPECRDGTREALPECMFFGTWVRALHRYEIPH